MLKMIFEGRVIVYVMKKYDRVHFSSRFGVTFGRWRCFPPFSREESSVFSRTAEGLRILLWGY